MAAPSFLFYVEVRTAPGSRLRYAEKGGGKFTTLPAAKERRAAVLARHPHAAVRILSTATDWKEVVA
jgi:hypothetical protein